MSENYFYSSLSGQEIEDTLVGAVRFNAGQQLTTSQKLQARQNIGAGEADTQIKIKGFYDTLAELQQAIPVGNEGDVYAVGTESPYDIYIWDAVHSVWVNNGPISFSDAIIDDNDVSTTSVWSSSKTNNEIAEVSSDVDAVEGSLATYARPNLIDNWYFVGGGSQGGDGIFPVNQRGQSNYTGTAYCVDRWKLRQTGGTAQLSLSAEGATLSCDSTNNQGLSQPIKPFDNLLGKTVTISIIVTGFSGATSMRFGLWFANSAHTHSTPVGYVEISTAGFYALTVAIPSSAPQISGQPASYLNFGFFSGTIGNNKTITFTAVKLEIGDTQTLAHQKNGAWVLNEIPNYANELAKCQRYYIKFEKYSTGGWITGSAKSYQMYINLPVTMASTPTPTITKYIARTASGYSAYTTSSGIAPTALTVPQFHGSNFIVADEIGTATETNNISLAFYIYDLALSCEP